MRDTEGFVELSVYMILVAIALPFVKHLEHCSPALATGFLILALAPMPTWIIGARFGMPGWLARILVWNCWLVLASIVVMLIWLATLTIAA